MSRPVEKPAMEQGIPEAFFLDVDGTLLPIADSPETVVPTAAVCGLLNRLSAACDGALALVSGRPLRQVDLMFAPNRFVAAAQHGAERRDPGGMVVWSEAHLPALQAVGPRLRRLADSDPRLRLEDKGLAMALHYRRAPQLGDQLAIRMMTLLAPYSVLRLQPGKMVLEVCGAETGKGRAIEAYLRQPPFAGRRPIYIGDDLTDESGFEAVNARGGLSIKVGPEPSVAQERLADPAAVLAWLKSRLQGAESGDLARP